MRVIARAVWLCVLGCTGAVSTIASNVSVPVGLVVIADGATALTAASEVVYVVLKDNALVKVDVEFGEHGAGD